MYVVYDIISSDNGVEQHEKALIVYNKGVDLTDILHELALEYVMSPDGLKKYSNAGLTFDEFLKCLPPEKLAPYNVKIYWLDREAKRPDSEMIIDRYELKSYLTAMEHNEECIRKTRDVSKRYVRCMERLKADGHPLISTWDSAQVSDRALSWAWQFTRSGNPDFIKFFKKKLVKCVCRAGLSPQNVAWNGESDSQTA